MHIKVPVSIELLYRVRHIYLVFQNNAYKTKTTTAMGLIKQVMKVVVVVVVDIQSSILKFVKASRARIEPTWD